MNSSQRALQTNRKLFSNFEFVFDFLAENFSKERGVNIDQIAICHISMDSSQRALQTNNNFFFSNFNFVFKLLAENRKIFKPREYRLKCNALYINGFDSTSSTN